MIKAIVGTLILVGCTQVKDNISDVKFIEEYADITKTVGDVQNDAQTQAGVCPDKMERISGWYCPSVYQRCLRWLDKDQRPEANGGEGPLRCAEFEKPSKCLSPKKIYLDFCMSKFEYPGTEGSFPLVGINYFEAKALAKKDNNRLCTVAEWNFAGEGEDMKPYPYLDGFKRKCGNDGCNCDKEWRDFNKYSPSTWNDHIEGELNQSIRSDSNSQCHSEFNIYNLAGNVDEILDSENSKNVILTGGYFGPVRDRVRPKTTSHSKYLQFYQIGFRECRDIFNK